MAPEFDFSRRGFLSTALAAGAGLALKSGAAETAPAAVPAQTAPSNRIRYALIGCGAEGSVLLDALLKIEGVEIAAICDIWKYKREGTQKSLKANYQINVPAYENFEDLLATEKDIQAAVVATPDFWHAPISNGCLKKGLHVYCEKMMSNTMEGARSMVKTMKETGKLLQIGHQRRSNPRYRFVLNYLMRELKLFGRLTAANAQWNRAVTQDLGAAKAITMKPELLAKYGYEDMYKFRNWRWFKKYGGGPLSDLGAHQIDIFNWYFGVMPVSVTASGGVDYYKEHEWYDNAMCIYEYKLPEGMARAFYQVQTTTSAGGGYWEYFMGDQGSIKMSENPSITQLFQEANAPDWKDYLDKRYLIMKAAAPAEDVKVDVRESKPLMQYALPGGFNKAIHQPHLENFFNAIRDSKVELNCPADEAFRSESVIHKASEAIAAKRTLDITPADYEV
ncbi:MAG: Gfo/Idh/MocA family oxidoreductase [Kiritimatiellaeota bacterium]|nr:Gfo/Idh/MocA family oxidoreductase [Kiritimatiellota bacterium]